MPEKDFGSEMRKIFTSGDDQKHASIEAAKMMSRIDKHLALKTEIADPMTFSVMAALGVYLKGKKMNKSAKLIEEIMQKFMIYAVSKDRLGRKEMIEIFKNMREEPEHDWQDKMFNRQMPSQGG